MSGTFRVQGRLVERRGPAVVRDETRQSDVDGRDEAFRVAELLSRDGFTVWVWAVDPRTVPATLDLVERIAPTGRAGPAPPPTAGGPPAAQGRPGRARAAARPASSGRR